MRIAGIGSRALNGARLDICRRLGAFIATCGGEIHSGNAGGADQAFARGGNSVDPRLVHLHLPWPNFEARAIHPDNVIHLPQEQSGYAETAAKYHPAWKHLTQGGRKLHTRNVSIVCWPTMKDMVLAFPSNKKGGGGTGQGMRVAEGFDVPVIDLNGMTNAELSELCERLRTLRSKS